MGKKTGNGSVRDSRNSHKSNQSRSKLPCTNSRTSLRSNESFSRNRSRPRSRQKSPPGPECGNDRSRLHSEEVEVGRETRKISNLEKELLHYKRLSRRQEEQLETYRVM